MADTTPGSNEPDGHHEAPVWALLVILAIVVVGVLWVLWTFIKSGTV